MKRIILIGASGHGKVCAEIAKLTNRYNEILFLDDNPLEKKCNGYDVVGTANNFYEYIRDDTEFFVSIGNAGIRKDLQERIVKAGGNIATLTHPNVVTSCDTQIGEGTVIMAGTVINTCSEIGKGCIINTASSVDHDCIIGDYCHIAVGAHICGTVNVGDMTWIGAGATVINNVFIASKTIIGAGAVVVKDIERKGKYLGIPARTKVVNN